MESDGEKMRCPECNGTGMIYVWDGWSVCPACDGEGYLTNKERRRVNNMKEEKVYICDYCGAGYKNTTDAEKCEKYHHQPKCIKGTVFRDRSSWYPEVLMVEFENGNVERYEKGR